MKLIRLQERKLGEECEFRNQWNESALASAGEIHRWGAGGRVEVASLALVVLKDVEHVDREARRLIVSRPGVAEALVFVVPVLVVVGVAVSLLLRLGAGLSVVVLVPVAGSLLFRRPSLKSYHLRQVCVSFPVLCKEGGGQKENPSTNDICLTLPLSGRRGSVTSEAAVARRPQAETQPAVDGQPQEAVGRTVDVVASSFGRLVAPPLCPG